MYAPLGWALKIIKMILKWNNKGEAKTANVFIMQPP